MIDTIAEVAGVVISIWLICAFLSDSWPFSGSVYYEKDDSDLEDLLAAANIVLDAEKDGGRALEAALLNLRTAVDRVERESD